MGIFEFLDHVQRLKRIPRSGWISRGVRVEHAESVAEHSLSTSILTMLLVDRLRERGEMVAESKAIKMALLHDLCESLTFDIDKRHVEEMGKAAEELKDKVEREAMRRILAELPDERMAREYAALREEMSEGKSFEARVVCAADCLDILLQLMDYERMGYSKKMFDDFWRDTMKRIHALKVSVASLLADELGKRR